MRLVDRTRNGGAEIVSLLKNRKRLLCAGICGGGNGGSDPQRQEERFLPCAAYLEGEYNISGLFIGVPVKLGKNGIEEIIQITLTDEEQKALNRSADAVKELVETLKTLGV